MALSKLGEKQRSTYNRLAEMRRHLEHAIAGTPEGVTPQRAYEVDAVLLYTLIVKLALRKLADDPPADTTSDLLGKIMAAVQYRQAALGKLGLDEQVVEDDPLAAVLAGRTGPAAVEDTEHHPGGADAHTGRTDNSSGVSCDD